MATVWEEFGIAVAKARAARKWTLEALADVAFGNKERKGYVSQIEKGRTRLNIATIQKLAKALELPDAVTDPLYRSHLPDEDKLDTDARRLMSMASADSAAPTAAEPLLIALAYEFAQGSHIELSTAYTGLRKALEAAAEMRAELARLHNIDARLAAVLKRVEDLNNQGLRDAAGEELEAAIKAKEAELDALHETALKQDRLRNHPEAAAKRLIKLLRQSAPTDGFFAATQRLIVDIGMRGEEQGDPFDLLLALELAKANHDRAKGPQVPLALTVLGNCHLSVGARQASSRHLILARKANAEALRLTSRLRDPLNWAAIQGNIGNVLLTLGERRGDTALLEESVLALRSALTVFTPKAKPMEWARLQNNLGSALRTIGRGTDDTACLEKAISAYRSALTVLRLDAAPTDWAKLQGNLGNVLLSLGERTTDVSLCEQAVAAHRAALTILTPTTLPMAWSTAQNNLGTSLRQLAIVSKNEETLEEAAMAFAASLTYRLRDAVPFLWAGTQMNCASLALARNAVVPKAEHLTSARHHLALAREVFAQEGNVHQLAECDRMQAQIDAA